MDSTKFVTFEFNLVARLMLLPAAPNVQEV
jgi:hypothetical protein